MNKQSVQIGFGKAVYSSTMATFSATKVTAPWVRVSAASSGQLAGLTAQWRTYAAGVHPEVNGTLYHAPAMHEPGTMLMLSSSWKMRGLPYRDGSIIVRLRETGPKIAILAKVPLDSNNRIGETFKVFEGRGDILSPDEAQNFGLSVPDTYAYKFMDPVEVDECFDIQLIDDELAPLPAVKTVVTAAGQTKVVEIAQAPARRMTFRKKKE